jgi:hypothetical protein
MKVALYSTWSPVSHASSMVLRQIEALYDCGYKVFTISSSPQWDAALRGDVTIHRPRQVAGDFGAWQQAFEEFPGLATIEEVLLASDSHLGPICPLPPIVQRMRTRPANVISMTHTGDWLDLYFVMLKTPAAIEAAADRFRDGPGNLSEQWRSRGITLGAEYGRHQPLARMVEIGCPFVYPETLLADAAWRDRLHGTSMVAEIENHLSLFRETPT